MVAPKRKSAEVLPEHPKKKWKAKTHDDKGDYEGPAPSRGLLRPQAEPAFVRGGADALTPIERRKIVAQAAQDILFEDHAASRPHPRGSDDDDDGDGVEDGATASRSSRITPKRKRRDEKRRIDQSSTDATRSRIICDGLKTKKLVPGAKVLGQVCQVQKNGLVLALPNNLTGHVSIHAISDGMTRRIDDSESDDDEGPTNPPNDQRRKAEIDLKRMFSRGQWLRATVIPSPDPDESDTPRKPRIELSINPSLANEGLNDTDIAVNVSVQAEVISVEDHGVVVNLGLKGSKIRGFVPSKEIPGQDLQALQQGAVLLGVVTSVGSNGKVVKLSFDPQKMGDIENGAYLKSAPGIGVLLPGTAVDFLISDVLPTGVVGKVFGLVDIMADVVHSVIWRDGEDTGETYSVGQRIRGRLIWTSEAHDQSQIGVSLLPHILSLDPAANDTDKSDRIGEIIDEARVSAVRPGFGLFMDIAGDSTAAFVHISRVADEKVDVLSESMGPYMTGTAHRCRLTGYNAVDDLFLASLSAKTLALPFLRLDDLCEGQVVRGSIERLTESAGMASGALVKLTDTVTGFVPVLHLSDVTLSHPERKYRPGVSVTARVLNLDTENRTLMLTLKKTLVNSDAPVWTSWEELTLGSSAPGTITKFVSAGAIVHFFGSLKGLLPLSQMSESYITDPQQHFRLGQVVNVRVLSVDPSEKRLILTCRDNDSFTQEQKDAVSNVAPGSRVEGKIIEKTRSDIVLEIAPSKITAILPVEHLVDGSEVAALEAAKSLHIGQKLSQLLVVRKDVEKCRLQTTRKPSLIKATPARLPTKFEDFSTGSLVDGYVENITDAGIFVSFLGGMTALLPKKNLDLEVRNTIGFGVRRNQSFSAYVSHLDSQQRRVTLSMREPVTGPSNGDIRFVANPVDGVTSLLSDFVVGKITRARVTAVNENQLNVHLADGVRGRIEVSQAFKTWDDIQDKKHPLNQFTVGQELPVRILGTHDSKTHRFLPISHFGKSCVYELSTKLKTTDGQKAEPTSARDAHVGSKHMAFVNNVNETGLWVNLTPTVRGRVRRMEVSEDIRILADLEQSCPVGSALQVVVTEYDAQADRLLLSARADGKVAPQSVSDLTIASTLPALVTKVSPESVIVQLSDNLSAPIHRIDLADDYSQAAAEAYEKNQIIRVCVRSVDEVKNSVRLSTRPSKVLSSSSVVMDREILTIDDLKVNDVVRGFIKDITTGGLFVTLMPSMNAMVKVHNISDSFIKNWSAGFERGQLVKAKVIAVNKDLGRVELSLKESVLSKNYKPPKTYNDIHAGQIVAGKVRKVESFGVFIVIDNSANVSGLCHRTEVADDKIGQIEELYDEGDAVRAVVLKVDIPQRRISLSMKPSQLAASGSALTIDVSEDESDDEEGGVVLADDYPEDVNMDTVASVSATPREHTAQVEIDADPAGMHASGGLAAGGFTWTLPQPNASDARDASVSESETELPKKSKRKKTEVAVDRTADLDADGPQSGADFERLLLGQANSSSLWLQYMAFELEQGEVEKARAIAERAVRSINHQSAQTEQDALNAWVGYLNLENAYGDDTSLESVFERACEVNDPQAMHSKLISVYIQSGKPNKADDLLQKMAKKYSQDAAVWENYAAFLFDVRQAPDRARALLPRAMQSLPSHTHIDITRDFARLEFRSKTGQPERGRTIFEGLISNFPKRLDLWSMLLDLEMKVSTKDEIRLLFERITSLKMKPRPAKKFFSRWLDYEEKEGDAKSREKVRAKAEAYVLRQKESQ